MVEKIKLDRMESAILSDMFRSALRWRQREMSLGKDCHVGRGLCETARTLIDKCQASFELPEDSIVNDWNQFRSDLTNLQCIDGKTKKGKKWLVEGEEMPIEVAFKIFDLHLKDMMDTGYYEGFTEQEQNECLRLFGGTFANERGELLNEVLQVIRNAFAEKETEKDGEPVAD